ncbi:MAG: hypothetical protein AB7P19_11770, partial [Nitrospira sp.]
FHEVEGERVANHELVNDYNDYRGHGDVLAGCACQVGGNLKLPGWVESPGNGKGFARQVLTSQIVRFDAVRMRSHSSAMRAKKGYLKMMMRCH